VTSSPPLGGAPGPFGARGHIRRAVPRRRGDPSVVTVQSRFMPVHQPAQRAATHDHGLASVLAQLHLMLSAPAISAASASCQPGPGCGEPRRAWRSVSRDRVDPSEYRRPSIRAAFRAIYFATVSGGESCGSDATRRASACQHPRASSPPPAARSGSRAPGLRSESPVDLSGLCSAPPEPSPARHCNESTILRHSMALAGCASAPDPGRTPSTSTGPSRKCAAQCSIGAPVRRCASVP